MAFAGTIETVGSDVTEFQVGDRVSCMRTHGTMTDPKYGSFQEFALCPAWATSKLPSNVSLENAAATAINLATVASAISIHLGFDRPPLTGTPAPKKNQKILVYGGTSSVGSLAISYAKSAGYDVVTTSSPKHLEYIQSLGADVIIDHTEPQDKVVANLKANGPYPAIFDTIGTHPVNLILGEYISSIGGGAYNTVIPNFAETPIPENVERKFASYGWEFEREEDKDSMDWFYKKLVPEGLASGAIVPNRIQRVEGGLAQIQHALDLMDQNQVSGHKLVMTL